MRSMEIGLTLERSDGWDARTYWRVASATHTGPWMFSRWSAFTAWFRFKFFDTRKFK